MDQFTQNTIREMLGIGEGEPIPETIVRIFQRMMALSRARSVQRHVSRESMALLIAIAEEFEPEPKGQLEEAGAKRLMTLGKKHVEVTLVGPGKFGRLKVALPDGSTREVQKNALLEPAAA